MGDRPSLPRGLLHGGAPGLVGRRVEVARMSDIWESVRQGDRHAIFVGGEPGAGKSRLVGETAAACHDDGALVLAGWSVRDGGYPFQPVVEMLEHLLATSPPEAFGRLDRSSLDAFSVLSSTLPANADPPRNSLGDPGVLFAAVSALVHELCVDHPVVLVFEDLQWAGALTLRLLDHLISRTRSDRLLVLGTFRTTAPDRSEELTQSISRMFGMPGVNRMDLSGLDAEEITRFVMGMSRMSAASARPMATVLRDQTGGNPLFLEELWRDIGRLPESAYLRLNPPSPPDSIRDMLALRLASMPETAITVLENAAIAGEVIDLQLLRDLGLSPSELLRGIEAGLEYGFLSENNGVRSFRHALARQAVIDHVPLHRRARLHADVGAAIEARGRSGPEVWAALGHHFEEAAVLGYERKAVEYLTAVADSAHRTSAHLEAAEALERAARLAPPEDRVELLLAAAARHVDAGSLAAARHRFLQLAQTSDPVQLARAAVGHEDACMPVCPDRSVPVRLLRAAVLALPVDHRWHLLAMASLGRALLLAGAVDEGRAVGETAVRLARKSGDRDVLIHALERVIHRIPLPGEVETQWARARELHRLVEPGSRTLTRGWAIGVCINMAYRLGSFEDFESPNPDMRDLDENSGLPVLALAANCYQMQRSFLKGNFADARGVAERQLDTGAFLGTNAEGVYGIQMFMLQRATGAIRRLPRPIVEMAAERATWTPGLLALFTELGMTDRASPLIRPVLDLCDSMGPTDSHWSTAVSFSAEAIALVGDRAAAERLSEMLEPYAGTNLLGGHMLIPLGSADRFLAYLDHVLGRPGAVDRFEQALEMDRRMKAVTHEAETLLSFAAHLDSIGGRRYAEMLRRQGQAIARRLGLGRRVPLQQEPVEAVVTNTHGLSLREMEVLRLLAKGKSNRDIGSDLEISTNTAANHVRNILAKTGAANRTQAAMMATDWGLVDSS